MADFKHFFLHGTGRSEKYTPVTFGGGPQQSPPRPERTIHGTSLLTGLERARQHIQQNIAALPMAQGIRTIPMEFEEHGQFEMMIDQLEKDRLGIRILNARTVNERVKYTVAVPNESLAEFANYIDRYIHQNHPTYGTPQHEKMMSGIQAIGPVDLREYWTDDVFPFPEQDQTFWWEVWLQTDSQSPEEVETWFRQRAAELNLEVSSRTSRFADRLVILTYTKLTTWQSFPSLLVYLAEFRRARVPTSEFTSLTAADQSEWINDLLRRLTVADETAPAVCVLDTGVNRGHPLLEQSLSETDLQSLDAAWQQADHDGHGTAMAGIALFGELKEPLLGQHPLKLSHRLESVKILPPHGINNPPDYGPITQGAIALAEKANPHRSRTICMAVTAPGDERGSPTLWSASIDQISSGQLDGQKRLICLAAGNIRENAGNDYPDQNQTSGLEDPAQAWNAITVGAYTDLTLIDEHGLENYVPIAPRGGLSPTSRTSITWSDTHWPFKPDVVCEGGNMAQDSAGNFVTFADDLELLTVQLNRNDNALLGTMRETSAATAQAARFGAILQSEYPDYWPETIRALIVHSAEWTPTMLQEFQGKTQRCKSNRLRTYGMGVPNLARARRSAKGFATMVVQDSIQPYKLEGSTGKANELRLHSLPIPQAVLQQYSDVPIRMRVTLSYFIEPNPGRRGNVARYRYASHGLRFSVMRPNESQAQLVERLSRAEWPGPKRPEPIVADDRKWDLGETLMTRGSIHSDAWSGTAAELAMCNHVVVYPVTGWWREKRDRSTINNSARYSLIVTLSTDSAELDLYAAIEQQISIPIVVA